MTYTISGIFSVLVLTVKACFEPQGQVQIYEQRGLRIIQRKIEKTFKVKSPQMGFPGIWLLNVI